MSKIQSLFLLLATFSLSGCSLFPSFQAPNEPEVSSSLHETSNPIQSEEMGTPSSEAVEAVTITVDKTAVSLEVGQTVFVSARVTGSMNKNVT